MIKNYTLLLFLVLAIAPASARQRTRQEIKNIAQRLIMPTNDDHRAKAASKNNDDMSGELREVAATANYTVVAADQGGFAIIANDDANSPVIGYSTTSRFSTANPALAWYLSAADAALSGNAPRDMKASAVSIPADCKDKVDHLVTTQWNQGSPYWDMCPKDGTNKRCYTGCVATAMAQIINYYKYPTSGKGSATIYYKEQPYTVNFATARYDYDNMLTNYENTSYNALQKRAVAQLMYHCGVATKMTYSTNGSGAYISDAADGLCQNFGYTTKYYGYRVDHYNETVNYSDEEWYGMVYKELSDGHPILYAGTCYKEGYDNGHSHAFVLDGYDKDGNVGVNWGYGGGGDGYFSLDVLPLKLYSYDDEYSYYQEMVVIHKPDSSTGIAGITTTTPADGKMYDLSGREIASPAKGTVYIENGKKHIKQ